MSLRGNRTGIKSRLGKMQSRSGQAAIEYILLLAITIAVIYLFKEFYKQSIAPKLNYALGGYIECLLETGQLPAFGNTAAAQEFNNLTSGDAKCRIPPVSFTGGIAGGGTSGSTGSGSNSGGTGGSNGGSSGGSSSGSGGSNGSSGGASGGLNSGGSGGTNSGSSGSGSSSGSSATRVSNYNGSPNSGYSSGSGGYGSGGGESGVGEERDNPTKRKRSTPIGFARDRRQTYAIRDANGITGTDGSLGPGEGSTKQIENGAIDDMGEEYGRGGRRGRSRAQYRGVSGYMAEQYEKEVEGRPRITSSAGRKRIPVGEELLGSTTETRRRVDPPPPPKRTVAGEMTDEGLSFGNIFKYLLIAGIVIAIVVFFGGQVMNYTNSQEK